MVCQCFKSVVTISQVMIERRAQNEDFIFLYSFHDGRTLSGWWHRYSLRWKGVIGNGYFG